MKKRLAKKAFSKDYFRIMSKPGVNYCLAVPRNSKCWNVINQAGHYYGKPDYCKEYIDILIKAAKGELSGEELQSFIDYFE